MSMLFEPKHVTEPFYTKFLINKIPILGHLGCSQFLAIMDKAAKMFMYRFLCEYKLSAQLGKLLEDYVFQSGYTLLHSHQQ